MAIKFDFNRLRTAILGFVKTTDAAGSDVKHLPKLQYCPPTMRIAGTDATTVLLDDDFGKVIFLTQSGSSDSAITLPPPTEGGHLTMIVAATPSGSGDIVISSPTADTIVAMGSADAGADGPSNLLADTVTVEAASIGGERIEWIADGTYWFCYVHQNAVDSITFAG